MSELKTNQIATNDGNNVAIDNSLNLKSYDTTARNALTSAAGDMIYNTSGVTSNRYGGNGGSGIVVLRYPNTYTISQSGLTLSTATDGSDKVTTITQGTGTVSFS